MGRALLLIFCSVLFTLTLLDHGYTKGEDNEWQSFTLQYKYLIDDGKYELAERMLNNRLPQMEQYVETLSDEQKEMWQSLLLPLLNGSSESYVRDADRFTTYVQAVTSEDPYAFIQQELVGLQSSIENMFIPYDEINSKWERLSPTLQAYYPDQKIEDLSVNLTVLSSSNSIDAREKISLQLDKLLEPSGTMTNEALLWTSIMIGGTIVVTLSYVALRKFKAYRKRVRSNKSQSS